MVTINPADCKPGEVYEGTVHGAERTVLIRRDASDSYPWESLGEVLDHEDVSSLVRLVPARPVARDDLPDHDEIRDADDMHGNGLRSKVIDIALDAVVAHLNANGGLPADDRWRRAHAIVEQERDQARESLRRLRDETDFDLFTVRDQLKQCRGEREQMTRERDEWKARAEKVERERDDADQRCAVAESERDRWKLHHDRVDGQCAKAEREVTQLRAMEQARAEAAEARTAPAVTREDVEEAALEAVKGTCGVLPLWMRDIITAVWALHDGSDPAVYVVRESDVAAVEVERVRDEEWHANGTLVAWTGESAEDVRGQQDTARLNFIHREAVARAIEQDAAADPITDAIRDGLNVWGTTDDGVRKIAKSVRRAIGNDGGENARWLDQVRAAARREGQAEALRSAANTDDSEFPTEDGYGRSAYVRAWLHARANQIENGVSDE